MLIRLADEFMPELDGIFREKKRRKRQRMIVYMTAEREREREIPITTFYTRMCSVDKIDCICV